MIPDSGKLPLKIKLIALAGWLLTGLGLAVSAGAVDNPESLLAPDRFVRGIWTIEYLIQDPDNAIVPSQILTHGYEQIVQPIHRGYRITVKCDLSPVPISIPFKFDLEKIPENFRDPDLMYALSGVHAMNDAVQRVFAWIEQVAVYQENGDFDQSVETVLKRGTGNCVGRSVLAVEALRTLGISARTVSGCILADGDGQFHRWVEIDYPGIGTFPSEPGTTMDFVKPNFLVLAPGAVGKSVSRLSELNIHVEVIHEEKKYWIIDEHPIRRTSRSGMVCRKTAFSRYSAALIGSVLTPIRGECHAELIMNNQRYTASVDHFGNYCFYGLDSGRYTLSIVPSWTSSMVRTGELSNSQLIDIAIKLVD